MVLAVAAWKYFPWLASSRELELTPGGVLQVLQQPLSSEKHCGELPKGSVV